MPTTKKEKAGKLYLEAIEGCRSPEKHLYSLRQYLEVLAMYQWESSKRQRVAVVAREHAKSVQSPTENCVVSEPAERSCRDCSEDLLVFFDPAYGGFSFPFMNNTCGALTSRSGQFPHHVACHCHLRRRRAVPNDGTHCYKELAKASRAVHRVQVSGNLVRVRARQSTALIHIIQFENQQRGLEEWRFERIIGCK